MQKQRNNTTALYAQGDILLETVEDPVQLAGIVGRDPDGAIVLARGEATGHRHAIHGDGAMLFRDDALARDLPAGIYIGHLHVRQSVRLSHEEHGSITLPKGTYRVRRQREFDGWEQTRIVAD